MTDKDSKLSMLGGTWTFTPDSDLDLTKVKVPGVDPDDDYLSFGYWVKKSVDDGKTTIGVNTYFNGGMMYSFDNARRITLEGSADYAGPASGKYVKKTFGSNGVGVPTSFGIFNAEVDLTARFGGDELGTAANYEIDGTVQNFKDSASGNEIDSMWGLELEDAGFASGETEGSGATEMFQGMTKSMNKDLAGGDGQWQGQFFGPAVDNPTDNNPIMPSSVAGEFNGHFINGHVIGAFGAMKQDE